MGSVGAGEYTNVKGAILDWENMLYVTSADHIWARRTSAWRKRTR